MVFTLTANKRNLPKIPKLSKKKNKTDRNHADLTSICETAYDHHQRTSPDASDAAIYRKLSPSRAIFESNKLESACSFLRMLKLKLEKDVDETPNELDVRLERTPTCDTISSILDTLINVSDHITPIVSDVSDSCKSMNYSAMSQSSTISENHFNRTMLATNKLLEMSAKTGNNSNLTDGTYYFAHKVVANNLADLTVFKNSVISIGDKIYVDRNLLAQLVDLHALLRDTITKLKMQEEKYLTDVTYRSDAESDDEDDITRLSVYDTAVASPTPVAKKLFGKKEKSPKHQVSEDINDPASTPPSASSQRRDNRTAVSPTPFETANSFTTDKMKKKRLRRSQNAITEASVLSVDGALSDNEGAQENGTVTSAEEELNNKDITSAPYLTSDSTCIDGSSNYKSAVSTVGCNCDDINTTNSYGTMTPDLFSSAVKGTNTFDEKSSKLVGTITSILKQTSFYDPELVTSTPMKDNRTQTRRSTGVWSSAKANTTTISNQSYVTAHNETVLPSKLNGNPFPGKNSNPSPSVNSLRSRSKSVSSYPTALNDTSVTKEYQQGLEKCITELECMSKCLRQAAINKDTFHECFKIFPANERQLTDTELPHFHTIVGGVPVIIQITKHVDSSKSSNVKCCQKSCGGSTIADASTCCRDLPQGETKPLCKLLGTLSKAALDGCLGPRSWGPCNWKKTVLRNNNSTEKGDYEKTSGRTSILKSKLPRFRLKKRDATFNTDAMDSVANSNDAIKSDVGDSHASLPYVPAKSSLPKLDNPEKICSSLQFDVRKIPVTFEDSMLKHPDRKVNDALKNVTVVQLLDSFRPAKCCRKTVLNETPHSTMPYAASLQSLPLQEADLKTIHDIMQSNNVREFFKQQTLFEYYVHFQKIINHPESISNDGKVVTVASPCSALYPKRRQQMYQMFFFELFNNKKADDEEPKSQHAGHSPHQSSNSNNHPDLRILDFIKKIYHSDPIYEKKVSKKTRHQSREDGDTTNNGAKRSRGKDGIGKEEKSNDDEPRCSKSAPTEQRARHPHHHHHHSKQHRHHHQETNKCKKTETKSYYTSMESYSTSNANYYINSSTSSTVSSKCTRSKNSNSTMYSILLIPKNELNTCTSNNELSTSYAPSVNSLPFEDESSDERAHRDTETVVDLNQNDDTDDSDLLSPKNYAKTLNAIYELDENGNMRTKSQHSDSNTSKLSELNRKNISPSSSESRVDLPCNMRNLSTIYEIDEKLKGSDSSVNQKLSSRTFNANRHQGITNRKSNASVRATSSERSRIPVSIHSLSTCTIGSKEKLSAKTNRPIKTANMPSKSSLGMNRSQSCVVSYPLCDSNPGSLISQKSSKTSAYSQCNRRKKLHSSSIDSVETCTSTKDLVAKVHPKAAMKQSYVSATSSKSVKLQPTLDGTSNLELPITFDIVRPSKKKSCIMKIETNVMSLNIDSTMCSADSGIRDNRKGFRCYRSENMCVWPQLQKKFETSNKAFYMSVHASQHDVLTANCKPSDRTSRIKVLQRYPTRQTSPRHCIIQQQHVNKKSPHLSTENFMIGNIQGDTDDSKARSDCGNDRSKARKYKRVLVHPEVIDIKVSSDVKSTKLNHRLFKKGYGPGYVTVLSPPCNCPDITIFLPCCCDQSDSCTILKNSLSRDAQQYSVIPVVGKNAK